MIERIVFGQPGLSEEEISEITAVLRSGWIGSGPKVEEFESKFAAYQGAPFAVAVSSCTAALFLALKSYDIGEGDEVITTAMTFPATVNAIIAAGATPVLVDVESRHFTLDARQIGNAITSRTKAIIPVHFGGAPADLDHLAGIRQKFGIKLIHDCAHAIETEWNQKKLGGIADAACYSFYPTKNLTTIEGGMICSGDETFVERARLLGHQGLSKSAWKRYSAEGYHHFDALAAGFKFNLTDVQAALGICQLRTLGERHARRKTIWEKYQSALSEFPDILPREVGRGHLHAHHLYPLRISRQAVGISRNALLEGLQERGIGCGVHYRPLPQLTYFREKFRWRADAFPVAKRFGEMTRSLPLSPYLSEGQVEYVVSTLKPLLKRQVRRARSGATEKSEHSDSEALIV